MIQNPWRKGVAAGIAYAEAMNAYNSAWRLPEAEKPTRPERPVNPYPLSSSRNGGAYQWQCGFKHGVERVERERRMTAGRKPR